MDLFVVPTIGFDLLYALVIIRLVRRDLVRINSDLSGIGNPIDLAKQWAAEMKLSPDEFLAGLLKHFGADGQD